MKRYLGLFIMLLICVLCISANAESGSDIEVMYLGKNIEFDTAAYASNGRIMVPVRAIFEAVGATVEWDDNTKTAVAQKDGTVVTMTLDSNIVNVNGVPYTMDAVIEVHSGRIHAPARYVAESFGKKISYHQDSRTAVISDNTEYVYYENLTRPIPKFDWIDGAVFLSGEKHSSGVYSYKYSCDDAGVTEYLNYLQLDFGYAAYNMQYQSDEATYTYVLNDLMIDITESGEGNGVCTVVITPDTKGLYQIENKSIVVNERDKDDVISADYSEVDFGKITGIELYEVYDEQEHTMYVYPYDMMAVSYYESYVESQGWVLYDYSFDIDSFSNSKYWVKGDDVLCLSVSYIYDMIMVSLVTSP